MRQQAIAKAKRYILVGLLLTTDVLIVSATPFLAFWLRFEGNISTYWLNLVWQQLPLIVGVRIATFYLFRLYHRVWRYASINELLVSLAREGLHVVRLKGGDPFIFGRGGEEMAALEAAGIPFEIVPGVTTASAVGAYTGVPLTHRAHACTLVLTTGHLKEGSLDLDWDVLARERQTLVVYMGLAALPKVCAQLMAHGLPATTPGLVVQSATTRGQRSVAAPISELAEKVAAADLQSPALIVIGAVAGNYSAKREAGLLAE